jgi:effector-binding domain-containing protein
MAYEITTRTLGDQPAAVTTHLGLYEGLEDAYKEVAAWLAEHGYRQTGPHWEVYYTDPQQQRDSSQWRTDLFVPYVATNRASTVSSS